MKSVKYTFCIMGIAVLFASCGMFINKRSERPLPPKETARPVYISPFMSRASEVRMYAMKKDFSTTYCFFVDMSIPSGRKRFFVYDLERNIVLQSGLVAHGSCQGPFLDEAKFSNSPGGGCTSLGKYRVGEQYRGQYGKSYKLYGLENTNSNAYRRAVVLHPFSCVPDYEIYPKAVCNSLGCAMVSPAFFEKLAALIDGSKKPVILWVYN